MHQVFSVVFACTLLFIQSLKAGKLMEMIAGNNVLIEGPLSLRGIFLPTISPVFILHSPWCIKVTAGCQSKNEIFFQLNYTGLLYLRDKLKAVIFWTKWILKNYCNPNLNIISVGLGRIQNFGVLVEEFRFRCFEIWNSSTHSFFSELQFQFSLKISIFFVDDMFNACVL